MGTINDIIAGSGQSIVVETELTGPQAVAVRDGQPNPLVGFIRPKVTVVGPGGVVLASVAPYGEPDAGVRNAKRIGIAVAVAGVLGLAFWLGRKSK